MFEEPEELSVVPNPQRLLSMEEFSFLSTVQTTFFDAKAMKLMFIYAWWKDLLEKFTCFGFDKRSMCSFDVRVFRLRTNPLWWLQLEYFLERGYKIFLTVTAGISYFNFGCFSAFLLHKTGSGVVRFSILAREEFISDLNAAKSGTQNFESFCIQVERLLKQLSGFKFGWDCELSSSKLSTIFSEVLSETWARTEKFRDRGKGCAIMKKIISNLSWNEILSNI